MSDTPVDEPKPYKQVTRWTAFFMIRTRRGLDLMDKLGQKKIGRPVAWLMLYLMPVAGAIALYVIFSVLAAFFSPQGEQIVTNIRTISPLANFLLPGINPYLPLSVWLAVVVAIVIHEGAHGVVARSLGLPVKSSGILLFLFLPIGAFVEVDDKQLRSARSRDSLRVLAAGAGVNFVVGIVCIILLIITVGTLTPAAHGAAIIGVLPDTPSLHSPASLAGIHDGDFVTAIDNSPITDLSVIRNGSFSVGEAVNLTIWRNGQTFHLDRVVLGSYPVTTSNQTSGKSTTVTYPFLGVESSTYGALQGVAHSFANLYKVFPLGYISDIPTFAQTQGSVPYSDSLANFYTSPLGALTPAVELSLFWLFFVNFNLAIFNSLPIYPMDGGQAFESFLRGAGRGRISDELARRVTTGVTLLIFFALFVLIAGPYLSYAFPSLAVLPII